MSKTQAPDPAQAPRPFTAVKAFADSVLAMLDERIKTADQGTHPFNDYFGDKPEAIVTAKAQASELREVRTQVRMLGDRALVDLMKFKPAIPAPEGADEREECVSWLSGLYPDAWPRQDAEHAWDHGHVFSLAWKERGRRAALAAPAPQATDAELERRTGEPHVDGWPLVSGLPVPVAPAWQPIETAPMPRDGGTYLVADAVRGFVAPHIQGVIHNNTGTANDWQYGEAITHWMPLPAAPQTKEPTNDR